MTEVAVQAGGHRHLSGVVSLPDPGSTTPLGIILMNAGVIHRVGPHRFNVKLARRLAGLGYPVLRLDLSGLGDSLAPPNGLPYEAQSVADLQSGMESLAAVSGATSFVLAGICSGARNAWATALVDERVRGVWMVDGFYLQTRKTPWHYWVRKAAHEGLWPLARRLVLRLPQQFANRGKAADDASRIRRKTPDAEERFLGELSRLVRRGVRPCFVYSGSRLRQYSYESQLNDRLRGRVPAGAVTVHFMPEVDHTLTTLDGQAVVARQVEEFCKSITAGAMTGAPPP